MYIMQGWWNVHPSAGGALIPTGLILPTLNNLAPTGWEAFNSANNKSIVGAGSSYSAGATGGSAFNTSLGNYGGATSQGGLHTGNADVSYLDETYNSGWNVQMYNQFSEGEHSHALGAVTVAGIDQYQSKLIRATEDSDVLPPYVGIFSGAPIGGLTAVNNQKLFGAYSSGRTLTKSGTLALGTAGLHDHVSYNSTSYKATYGGWDYYYAYPEYSQGEHSGSVALNVMTQNFKRLLLSLWYHATANVDVQSNMIGMWESTTAPAGWALCDGTNGTPDMRDNFIEVAGSGSENTTSQGNNTITLGVSGSVSHSIAHSHSTGSNHLDPSSPGGIYHGSFVHDHTHVINQWKAFAFVPPYYALSFIIKL